MYGFIIIKAKGGGAQVSCGYCTQLQDHLHIVTFCAVGGHYPLRARSPSVLVHSRLRRLGLIAEATKSMDGFDLVSKERVDTLRPACRSYRQSSGC